MTTPIASDHNPDDLRRRENPVFMSGNLPPDVPEVFDARYGAALDAVLTRRSPSRLIGAHQYRGSDRDRATGAAFTARRLGAAPSPERVVVANGTQSILTQLLSGLVPRGGVLAVEELTYPTIRTFVSMLGIDLAPVAMDGEGIDPDAFEHICRTQRPAALYTMPTLQNPTTGTMGDDHDAGQVREFLAGRGIAIDPVRYGVRAYRLTYRTVDPYGKPTTATGLLSLPKGGTQRLDLVSDTHGTMVKRTYAPSASEDLGRVPSYLNASAGRAVAAPDYLGLGEGPGPHPYMDTRSAVTASVDMLRAARTAADRLGRPLTGDVYATGFSQGGQVAMALGRVLERGAEQERGADQHFRLKGLAPVSGPYDLEGQEVPALFDGRVNDTSGVFYISYWLVAQNRLHHFYKDPGEVFRAPYASRVESLFDPAPGGARRGRRRTASSAAMPAIFRAAGAHPAPVVAVRKR